MIGSGELVRTLLGHDLVDELRPMIDPVVLGGGMRVFADDGDPRSLRLVEGRVTTTGATPARYEPAPAEADAGRRPRAPGRYVTR